MAIVEQHPIPWDIVRQMESLKHETSTRPDQVVLAAEKLFPIPHVGVDQSQHGRITGECLEVGIVILHTPPTHKDLRQVQVPQKGF